MSLFVAGLIFSQQDVGQYVATQLQPVLGVDATAEITDLLQGLQQDISNSVVGIVLLIATVFAASLLYVALEDGVNIVWEAPRRPDTDRSEASPSGLAVGGGDAAAVDGVLERRVVVVLVGKLDRWASSQNCTFSPDTGIDARSAAMIAAAPR